MADQEEGAERSEPAALILNIEIGRGTKEPVGGTVQEIKVGIHDKPQDVAKAFCEANKLDSDIQERIAKYIEKNLPTSPDGEIAGKPSLDGTPKTEQTGGRKRAHSQGGQSQLEDHRRQAFAADSKYAGMLWD
jgi:hypothetical protein